ncbi:MAG TPA: Gfo/Idh/MocA family oxidoreductase [Bryobacteraceae bacterium]|nr:Gfo/Idh/MocA family oxidoreductase [Bryobacteraceae bacterium]
MWTRRGFLGAAALSATSIKGQTRPVRLGFIGVGSRGSGLVRGALAHEAVEVRAICDINEERLARAGDSVEKAGQKRPEGYSRGIEDYKRLIARDDLDAVINAGPWELHTPMSVATMKAGKYAATEVPAATTIEECWELVRTSEETGMPCMMLENVCYFRNALLVLNMIRQGVFGEIIHCEGGYQHDVRGAFIGNERRDVPGEITWRGLHAARTNGNIYPTHPIGPIGWWLDINRGNRFTYLTSMSSKSRGMRDYVTRKHGAGNANAKREFALGDVNTSLLMTDSGATVTLYHDTTLPRPYDLILRAQGTRGIYSGTLDQFYIDNKSPKADAWEDPARYYRDYEHPLWKALAEKAKSHGHGGADYLTMHQFLKAVRNRTQPPIDVYDTAVWSAITPLTADSVAKRSAPVDFPDFTRGKWKTRAPVTITNA